MKRVAVRTHRPIVAIKPIGLCHGAIIVGFSGLGVGANHLGLITALCHLANQHYRYYQQGTDAVLVLLFGVALGPLHFYPGRLQKLLAFQQAVGVCLVVAGPNPDFLKVANCAWVIRHPAT